MQPSRGILAYLVEGHPRNISVKLFENCFFLALEEISFKCFSILSSGSHLVYRSGTNLSNLVGSHLGNIPVKSESKWSAGFRGDSI